MEDRNVMRILYVGWVGFGNLGDDVCRDLFIAHFRRALLSQGRDCKVRTVSHRGITEEAMLEFRPHLVVLGAGSLLTLPYLQPLRLAQKHGIPTAMWGTGFDKLSARHLQELLEGSPQLTVWQDDDDGPTFS